MKVYDWTVDEYETNPGCDCCDYDVWEMFTCSEIDCVAYSWYDCYTESLNHFTGKDYYKIALD